MYDFDTVTDRRNTGSYKWFVAPKAVQEANCIPLSVADMEYKMAPEIRESLHEAVEHGICGYTLPDDAYFAAVASWQQRRHGFTVRKEWLSCTPGVVTALGIAVRAFTEKGDGVILQSPVYPPFWNTIKSNGRTLLENRLRLADGRYTMDFDELETLCKKPEAKLLILSSPHNPIGRVWTSEELLRLGRIAKENGVIVVADEIHNDLIFSGYTHTVFASLPGMAENCILCTAISKTFNLAGMNCSNIFIPNPELKRRFDAVMELEVPGCIPFLARTATLAAYTRCDAWVDEMLQKVQENFRLMQDFLAAELPELKLIPAEGTYLAWVDMRALKLSDAALEKLVVEKALLALDEGPIFGSAGSGFERWNLALPKAELVKALERLKGAIRG